MRFHSPLFLLALLIIPLIWWRYLSVARRCGIRFSSVDPFLRQAPTFATAARIVVPILRTLAVLLLAVALARPQQGNKETRVFSEGIAIQMVVDTSGSMDAEDFQLEGRRVNRLEAVKKVFKDFVQGSGGRKGRESDLIGLISFARYPDTKCPLTFDHENLLKFAEQLTITRTQEENGTAIGNAIALGVERLRDIRRQNLSDSTPKIKSKVMVLLTDGRQETPDEDALEPTTAAELAKTMGVKIYAIGAGSDGGGQGGAGVGQFFLRAQAAPIDEATLKKIADITGGKYFRATNMESLEEIYAEIDKLEKTKVEEVRYLQYSEVATPLLMAALAMLGLELLLVNTRFRQLP